MHELGENSAALDDEGWLTPGQKPVVLIASALLFAVATAAATAARMAYTPLPTIVLVLVACSLLAFFSVPLLLRLRVAYEVVAWMIVLNIIVLLALGGSAVGGLNAPAMAAMPFVPITATALLGGRGGALTAAITIAVLVSLIALHNAGVAMPELSFPDGAEPRQRGFMLLITTILVAVILLSFEARMRGLQAELRRLATADALTGLPNRRRFEQDFAALPSAADGQRRSMALLDIDSFKALNDRHGHVHGDECLVRLAALLRSFAEQNDASAYRIAGDEFVLLFTAAGAREAAARLEKLFTEVAGMRLRHDCNEGGVFSLSAGVADIGVQDEMQPTAPLQRADVALYAAKDRGRHQIVIADAQSLAGI